jgi:hypothetical protein
MSASRKSGGYAPVPGPEKPPLVSIGQPSLTDLVTVLAEKADPLVKLLTATVQGYQTGKEREVRLQKHMAWIAVSVVVLIIVVSGLLTYKGKIDGSTFTFLLGLIVGYVLTFVRDQITGPG